VVFKKQRDSLSLFPHHFPRHFQLLTFRLECPWGPTGALLWLTVMTVGEVAWSPRQSAWAASVAPVGREGVFVRTLLIILHSITLYYLWRRLGVKESSCVLCLRPLIHSTVL
jgi:hypothetical protein